MNSSHVEVEGVKPSESLSVTAVFLSSTDTEKGELIKILEEAEAGGEIDLDKTLSRHWTDIEKNDAKRILEEIADSGEFDLSPFYNND